MFFTAGIYQFDLRTKCINGKQGVAKIVAVGPGIGFGIDASASISNVTLNDSLLDISPQIMDGQRLLQQQAFLGRGKPPHSVLVQPSPGCYVCSQMDTDVQPLGLEMRVDMVAEGSLVSILVLGSSTAVPL